MSQEVGSEHPGEKGWLGLRCPGFVGFQMAWDFLARIKFNVGS
jgi:hypothetical protein